MKKNLKVKGCAIFLALFFYAGFSPFDAFALPLTETVYSIPEDQLEFSLKEEVHHNGNYYTKEQLSIGMGITPNLSIWFLFDYLHLHNPAAYSQNQIGDVYLKVHSYLGDVLNDTIHFSFLILFRFPTGKDAYSDATWRNLSFGNNEITMGPIVKFDIIEKIFLHFNLFYTFRAAPSEDFYGGFHIDPFSAVTWENVFGLNFMSPKAFLYYERLKNDYMTISLAVNTNAIYPVVPFFETNISFRLYRDPIDTSSIMIKAAGSDPALFLSVGANFFITKEIFIGLYAIFSPIPYQNFTSEIYGFNFSIQF
jgi:hypothetical protein